MQLPAGTVVEPRTGLRVKGKDDPVDAYVLLGASLAPEEQVIATFVFCVRLPQLRRAARPARYGRPVPWVMGGIESPGRSSFRSRLAELLLLVATANRYGYHRDELYFRVAARHPAWGYDDQPALTPLLGRLSEWAFGSDPRGLRMLSAVAIAIVVVLVALIARELGAGRRARRWRRWRRPRRGRRWQSGTCSRRRPSTFSSG